MALIFIKLGLKLSYFFKKKIIFFRALGAPPQHPRNSPLPPLQNSGYAPGCNTAGLVEGLQTTTI